MDKPNILFILTDQQRYDTCGCYGQELDITPNLDRMAKNGIIFEYAFSNQPICGPARSIIQTGIYATETNCFRNGIALPLSDKNIADYLSNAGYKLGYIGKWHLASNILTKVNFGKKFKNTKKPIPSELRGGYKDFWLAADALEFTSGSYKGHLFDANMKKVEFQDQYRVDFLTDKVLNFLDNRDENSPFFLFVSYLEPHHQNKFIIGGHFEGPYGSKEKFKNYKIPGDLEGNEGNWREEFPDYLGCCNSIDYNLARIKSKIKALGIEKNTIIIFTSDHGCHFKTRNSEYKRSCHESSIRVPLVIEGPGFLGGKRISELISTIDIAPTLLKIASIDKPIHMRGRPLQELLDKNIKVWPEEVFIQIGEAQVGRAIRTKKWKYSVKGSYKTGFFHSYSDTYQEQFLYDLEKDVYERNNLVNDSEYNSIKEELRKRLLEKIKTIENKIPKIIPPKQN